MEHLSSKKIIPWKKNDYIWNLIVYSANIIIFLLLSIGVVRLKDDGTQAPLSNPAEFISYTILLLFIFAIMCIFLAFEDKNFLRKASNSQMLFFILEISFVVCFISGNYVNIYLRPISLVALLTLFLVNTRAAMFMNIMFCIFLCVFDAYSGNILSGYDIMHSEVFSLVVGIVSATIAIYIARNVYSRTKLLILSLLISIPSAVCVAIPLIRYGGNDFVNSIICSVASGPLSAAVCMVLLPIYESLFKKVTCFKYAELTDHKAKLIKRMIEQAPGTFNHSMVVSNIAEACATAIGEDPLLARTCAYYHDVGKLRRPEMFKENQGDAVNPHNDLTPELSANIIKSHTQDGYALIKKNRIPDSIAEVCLQHHGTMPMLFFYDKAKKYTDGDVDILQYCYVGPKPKSKIAAIIMIADGAEAATRVLTDRSRSNVLNVVRTIVNERMKLGQFEECEITLKEITIIINTVVNSLTGIYHKRIEYPKVSLEGIDLQKNNNDD